MTLFEDEHTPIQLHMPDASVWYFPEVFDPKTSEHLFQILQESVTWQQDDITLFGKTYPQPRLTALYGDTTTPYRYSGIIMHPLPFSEPLLHIKEKVTTMTKNSFNTCLLNLYRNGKDSNGWHADNEKELGPRPIIASVSFGAPRWIHFKHRSTKKLKSKALLQPGSMLLMKGDTQQYWLHQIPKTKEAITPRINLTFRTVYP